MFACSESANGLCSYDEGSPYIPELVNACAYVTDPNNFQEDLGSIQAACSERCVLISNGVDYLCEDSNWFDIRHAGLKPQKCPGYSDNDMNLGSIGETLGETVVYAIQLLSCDLHTSCAKAFSKHVGAALWDPANAGPLGSELADHMVSTTADSIIRVVNTATMHTSGASVTGSAAYSVSECDEDSCPFYLGALEATLESPLTIELSDGENRSTQVSAQKGNLRLLTPTLGILVTSTGDVVFPQGSLEVELSYGLAVSSLGEVSQDTVVVRNPEPIYGTLIDGKLTLSYDVEDASQSATLALDFETS